MNTVPEASHPPDGPADGLQHDQRRARRPNTSVKLHRSYADRQLAGVCGGIAEYVEAPPWLVRALFAISLLPSLGVTGLAYLVLWWLLPTAPST